MAQLKMFMLEFIVFSIAGWFLEVIYRSLSNRRFINPGFLTGSYIPIYGIGAAIIAAIAYASVSINVYYKFFIYFIVLSFIEYATGVILYTVTGKRYWDYSDEPLNIQGHVCLSFSFIWGLLALAFEFTILPLYNYLVYSLNTTVINTVIIIGTMVMLTDFLLTHNIVQKLLSIKLPLCKRAQYRFFSIKLQNDALLSLRFFVDTLVSYHKRFFIMKPLQQDKFIALLKKRYMALIATINKKVNPHREK